MGRRRKYFSEEQKKTANIEKARKYYERNQEEVKKRNLEKYHVNKYWSINESGSV